ncbi:unnamed protein product [Thlaspi arvense]|uniref:Vps53 N-terminal domain-containing protein n=1 Tax=Thlaspi arvense TaxID=13288 RepID=A0AAU9R950_THLAR|nr:unnamed protein product [Thlaspi arvense]
MAQKPKRERDAGAVFSASIGRVCGRSHLSNSGTKAKQDLADATCAAEELSHKIQEIKSKAEQTEEMVQDICRDIKKLDFAKKNVSTAVTALHRLKMVVSAVEQLQVTASKRQYKEAAAQLEAVNELCNHFEAYSDVPKITELREKLKNIKQILKSHIFADFSSLDTGTEAEETNLLKMLSDSCFVVDALEPSVREELVNNFCSRELTSYEQIYVRAELTNLDEIERIYHWINRRIRTNQEIWKIFPVSWHFCNKAREQVESFLVNMKEKPDAERLLLELERTLKFEMELEMKFGEWENKPQNGSKIHMKYVKKFYANQESGANEKTGNNDLSDPGAKFNFRGIISSYFEPHLTPYIEKELMHLLEKVVQEETWDCKEETYSMEKSLKRCSALTKNQTLFNLFKVFQRVLKAYATKIHLKLPKESMDRQIKVDSERDERVICYIVNSAEYCHKTSGDLAEEISTTIDPHFSGSVDMSEVQDVYSSVITKGLLTLVRRLETKFDTKMEDMTRVPWGTLESVGDHSEYVDEINTILNNSIPVVGKLLTPVYFQIFLDKLASSLGLRFYANICRCKPISETGAQQMLLDTQVMEKNFLEVASGQTATGGSYSEIVKREMKRAEAVVKVILSPIDPEGKPMQLRRILEHKGLTKAEQHSILDDFNNHGLTRSSVASAMPQPPAPSLTITNPAAAVGFIANSEGVLTRAAVLGRGVATTSFRKFVALTEAAKDRPLRKLFNA